MPGVSPAAMQAGRHAARNIRRMLRGEKPTPWEYFDKGSMATIGRNAAVAEVGPFDFAGLLAWAAWVFVHLLFLMGFRNRTAVFLQWVWAYFAYDRGSRLIHGRVHERAAEPAMLPSLRAAQLAPARRALMDVETVEAEPQTTETERPEGEAASR